MEQSKNQRIELKEMTSVYRMLTFLRYLHHCGFGKKKEKKLLKMIFLVVNT